MTAMIKEFVKQDVGSGEINDEDMGIIEYIMMKLIDKGEL
jgi:hypothetical protein